MADFYKSIPKVLRHEGVVFDEHGRPIPGRTGLCNHPDDPGGLTNYGITKGTAIARGYTGDMKDIPYCTVLEIYRTMFWAEIRGEEIPDQSIADEVLDTAVNCGTHFAVFILQRVLNGHNGKESEKWQDLEEDGVMGQATLSALRTALGSASYMPGVILKGIDIHQGSKYYELARRDKRYKSFLTGWIRNRTGEEPSYDQSWWDRLSHAAKVRIQEIANSWVI